MTDLSTSDGSVADLDEGRFSFAVKGGTTAQQALLSALYTARFNYARLHSQRWHAPGALATRRVAALPNRGH